ncbi:hypothetical protein GCM10027614_61500 [Micromonospora vulcania]
MKEAITGRVDPADFAGEPTGGFRPERVDRRGDVPALPRRPNECRFSLARLLRRLSTSAGRRHPRGGDSKGAPAAAPEPDGQPEPAAEVSQPSAKTQPATASKPAAAKTASSTPAAAPAPAKEAPAKQAAKPAAPTVDGPQTTPLRGVAAKIVQNMDASLSVPTATSVRAVPAKLLVDNRIVINNHLARGAAARSASPTWSATRWSGRWSSTPR